MKSKYLLILEGETGKGFSAWLPDLPGVYAAGDSQRQVEVLAKEAADDEVAERDTLPAPPLRTSRQIDLLLNSIKTDEKLSFVYIDIEVPEALFVVRKRSERTLSCPSVCCRDRPTMPLLLPCQLWR